MSRFRQPEPQSWPEVQVPETIPLSDTARRYLARRGIHNPERFGISELEESTRVVIPYRGPYGRVIYWSTRAYQDDGKPKYITAPGRHPLYVLPDWRPHERVVLVEGVFDCIVHHLATGIPTIAIGGKSLPVYLTADVTHLAPGHRTVMLDGEALDYTMKLAARLGAAIHPLPVGMDPAEFFRS